MGMWGGIRQGIADQRAEQIEDEKLRSVSYTHLTLPTNREV